MTKQTEKHWYYYGERISHFGRVRAACGYYAHTKHEIDLQNPTCETCKIAKTQDNEERSF